MPRIGTKTIVILLLSSLLLAMHIFIGKNAYGQSPTTLRVDPASLEVATGSDFQVDAIVENVSDVFFNGIILTYNTSVIDAVDVNVYPTFQLINRIIDDKNGFVLVEGAGGPAHGTVPLAYFVFHCTGLGGSALNIADYYLEDPMQNPILVDQIINGSVMQWLLKPAYVDYAPNGVPDFDQKQDGWRNPGTGKWSWCGPTAVANSLWWLDSEFELNPIPPPVVNDGFPLVRSYGFWDDHDPSNVPPFIEDLAGYMDTDGARTGVSHNGTKIADMAQGIERYISSVGLQEKLYVKMVKIPDFEIIYDEAKKCEDTILLLGFWQEQPPGSGSWVRVGGHYVTVPGIDLPNHRIAFCDPYTDNAEVVPGTGIVKPLSSHGHPPVPPETIHNNATYISYDIYNTVTGSTSPGGPQLRIIYEPYCLNDLVSNMQGQNTPDEFEPLQGLYNPTLPVLTEVEYGVFISCRTGIVAAGSDDTNIYVWDFHGALQWKWSLGSSVVSVAMDNNGRFIAAGARSSTVPAAGSLTLFDNALGEPPNNVLWSVSLPVSTSSDGDSEGTESKSVDVGNNTYNGFAVVAAASDNCLYLFDQFGNLIWNYSDGSPETIVRISQDGNFIICGDYNSGVVHYFSHLRDGASGWGPNDGSPVWSFGGGMSEMFTFWTAIAGLGDYVAVSAYTSPVTVNQHPAKVALLDRTGSIVWSYALPKAGYVRVDMPCNGRSVVSVNDDPNDSLGCDLNYWNDSADALPGWGAGDAYPVWTYWPGKEIGNPQSLHDDFCTVAVSENGNYVVTGGTPANAHLLTKSGIVQQIVDAMPGIIQSVDLTFTGKYGASGGRLGSVWFFDNITGSKWNYVTGGCVHSVAVSKIYPCMFPFPNHDVAVTNVTTCKDGCIPVPIISQGYAAHIYVKVENQGNFTETFKVTLYANNTPVAATTVNNLTSKAQTTLTFVWNTIGFAKGNYVITAFVEIIQDEIDVADNTFTRPGAIKIGVPGDVNADNVCNMRDIGACCNAFGSTPETSRWNPNTDMSDDHIVDMRDIGIACSSFG